MSGGIKSVTDADQNSFIRYYYCNVFVRAIILLENITYFNHCLIKTSETTCPSGKNYQVQSDTDKILLIIKYYLCNVFTRAINLLEHITYFNHCFIKTS